MTGVRRWAMVAAAVAVLVCGQARAGEKYALLAGCVEYDNGPNLKPNDLPTTLNDIVAMYQMLTGRYGFKPENIRVLITPTKKWPLKPAPYGEATITNIADQFATWFAKAGPDDLIFFGYSGHGTYVHYKGNGVDVNEEALVGTDLGWIDPPQVLTFSQLRWLHSRLHDGQSVFVIDACHSGGGALAPNDVLSPFGPPPPVKFNPADMDTRPVMKGVLAEAGMAPKITDAQMEALRKRTTTVTACMSWEVASGAGPMMTLLDKVQQTGEMTGELVKAVQAGAQNQSWEDIGRTARFLSQLDCISQTVGVFGQGVTAMPFSQPAVAPTPPAYYVSVPEGRDLALMVDPFLGSGSVLEVFKDATPAGGAADLNGKLERTTSSDKMQLVSKVAADGPKAAVARTQDIGLPKLGVYAVVADLLGKEDAGLSKTLRDALAGVSYAGMAESDKDAAVDYRLWVSVEDDDTTRPFARARSGEFPEDGVAGKPTGRPLGDSVTWERGILHYLRAVQGAAWARNRACGFRVWATPDRERPLYLPGAPVKMRLEASAACYVVLVAADSMGNVTVTPAQAVAPGKGAEVAFTPPAGGAAHDMRLVVVKALAFAKKPSDAAVAKVASAGKSDPAKAMLGLLSDALGTQGTATIPTDGWADNEAFLAVWDRTPLVAESGL